MSGLPFQRIKRELYVRKKSVTSEKYGCKPEDRPVSELLDYGVVNIDKPKGPTSHQVSDYAKKILKIKKAGHSGTLDPKVTGVLPVALGRGTRVVEILLSAGKEYVCLMHLHKEMPEDDICEACASFVGKIKQLPPVKSAIKRQWRFRKIYYLDIIEIEDQDVLFRVGCQAGTYIRKLCHDIGEKLGCGAHMAELRRSQAGPFNESNLVTLQDMTDALYYYEEKGDDTALRKRILPIEFAAGHLPKIWITDSTVNAICNGAQLAVPGISVVQSEIQVGETVAVMTLKNELVSIGEAKMTSKDMHKKEKGLALKTLKVFMKTDTYPKIQNV